MLVTRQQGSATPAAPRFRYGQADDTSAKDNLSDAPWTGLAADWQTMTKDRPLRGSVCSGTPRPIPLRIWVPVGFFGQVAKADLLGAVTTIDDAGIQG